MTYVALAAIKIAIVLFYMRLTAFTSKTWMLFHKLLIILLVGCALATCLVAGLQCKPIFKNDIRRIGREGIHLKCIPILNLVYGFNVWHIVTDFILLVVPFKLLWRVQLMWTTKLRVCIAGIVGLANIALSIARAVDQATESDAGWELTCMLSSPSSPLTMTLFPLFCAIVVLMKNADTADQFNYLNAEVTLGVFTANLPILSVIATRATKRLLDWANISIYVRSKSKSANANATSGTPGRRSNYKSGYGRASKNHWPRQPTLLKHQESRPRMVTDPESASQASTGAPAVGAWAGAWPGQATSTKGENVEYGKDEIRVDEVIELTEVKEESKV